MRLLIYNHVMFVQVYKKDIIPHYNWKTDEVYRDSYGVICFKKGPRDLNHQTRNRIFTFPTDVIELYWFGKPFSLHIALDKKTEKLHYYSNIHNLPDIGENRISFVDYDLDVIREDAAPARIVDGEDFEKHKELFAYPEEVRTMVPKAAEEMKRILNHNPLFQKEALLEAFSSINRGEYPSNLLQGLTL